MTPAPACLSRTRVQTYKSTLKKRPKDHVYEWALLRYKERPNVVRMRVFPVNQQDEFFAQITVRFESVQTLTVRQAGGTRKGASGGSGGGKIIKGGPDKEIEVLEYYVFERPLMEDRRYKSAWRLCGKI